MSIITTITSSVFFIALLVIAIFIGFQVSKIFRKKKEPEKEPNLISDKTKPDGKESKLKKFGEGAKEAYQKFAHSDFVKGMQEEQQTAKASDLMPSEFFQESKSGEDPFSTDFSNLGKSGF